MKEIETNSLLLQMRSLAARASAGVDAQVEMKGRQIGGSEQIDFSTLMRNAINEVNSQQQTAAKMTDAFERGTPGVELN